MLLTPDKAEAQFLKKLGKAVNEVSNAIGKNDKKSSRKPVLWRQYSFYNPSTIYVSAECIVTDKPGVLYSAIGFSPKYYDMVTLPDLEIPFTMLRYPFGDDGVTVVRDGIINDKGEYVAIFKQNEF